MPSVLEAGYDFEAGAAVDPVDGEVAIEGEDAPLTALFGERDEGGVGQVHGPVGVSVHEDGAPFDDVSVEVSDVKPTGEDEGPQGVTARRPTDAGQEIHRFGQRRPGGDKRQGELTERCRGCSQEHRDSATTVSSSCQSRRRG